MADSPAKPRVDVAVAVVFDRAGQVLWGQRPVGKPYEGYWEFPGGKVEAGESIWQALVRELKEELGFTALAGAPWFIIEHDYEHANVRLHLYRVWSYLGQPTPLEGQAFTWASLEPSALSPILPATQPLLPVMAQSPVMVISHLMEIGLATQIARLQAALTKSVKLRLQFREPALGGEMLVEGFQALRDWAIKNDVPFCVNSSTAMSLLGAGVGQQELPPLHLTERHLLNRPPELASAIAVGASVHDASSLAAAFDLNLEYGVYGAVKSTPSHPGKEGMGWKTFAKQLANVRLPVYAIGGMGWADLPIAQAHGAHGIAMIRGL